MPQRVRPARSRRPRRCWPVEMAAGWGSTVPSIQAWSTIVCSIRLIVTLPPVCSSAIDSTHAASHGAGHSRPVNSGKLLVACRRSLAASHRPRRTRSFHSGIRLPSGQPAVPEWQNGIPQSMHRRACWRPRRRAGAGPAAHRPRASRRPVRRRAVWRPRSWRPSGNPVGSATACLHDRGVHVAPSGFAIRVACSTRW